MSPVAREFTRLAVVVAVSFVITGAAVIVIAYIGGFPFFAEAARTISEARTR